MKGHPPAFIHSQEIERYHYPENCPFKTERAGKTKSMLDSMGLFPAGETEVVPPVAATKEALHNFHTPEYVSALERTSGGELRPEDLAMGLGTDETPIFKDLFAYASLACGASLAGADLILAGKSDIVFNPSGGFHHALAAEAGGFCYLNDIALACKRFAEAGKRVFCLDIDAHHGNGTQAAFYSNADVMTVSFHESGETLYPWGGFENEIGEGKGEGYNINMPFPAGTDDDNYLKAFFELVPPLLQSFLPDIIVLEIGMDILSVDPLTHLKMTNNVLARIIPEMKNPGIPLLVTGGGGYEPESTARGWAYAWTLLTESQPEEDLWIGMGGTFLGSNEWSAGLKDKHYYVSEQEKAESAKTIGRKIDFIQKQIFLLHGISS